MKPTLITSQIAVYDDVLPPEHFTELLTWVNTQPFNYVHNLPGANIQKVWRPHDGHPMKGPDLSVPKTGVIPAQHPSYLHLLERVREHVFNTPVGGKWDVLQSTMWVYPPDSGLSLHTDGGGHSAGSYVYFLHPEWRLKWGGLLVVLDEATEREDPAVEGIIPPWLLDDDEHRRVWEPGFGRVILPRPNRMVFLSRGAQHMITVVSQGVRLSIGGFFRLIEPGKVVQM